MTHPPPAGFNWSALEAIGTISAATFAAAQIWLSRRDANTRAVLDNLRIIGDKAIRAGATPVEIAQQDVLDYYRGNRSDLSSGATAYLDLLNSLDLLSFAVKSKLVDRKKTNEHIRTLINPNLITRSFLKAFQGCCGDSTVYEHLYNYFIVLHPGTSRAKGD